MAYTTLIIFISLLQSFEFANIYEGRYTRNIKEEYEVVIPHRSNAQGEVVSYYIPQYFDMRSIHQSRRRRDGKDDGNIHYGLHFNDKYYRVELSPNVDFLSPGFVIEHHLETPKIKRASNDQCYYQGFVVGEKDSSAALSLCDGMAGYVRVKDDFYMIEPANGVLPDNNGKHIHLMYKRENYKSQERSKLCSVEGDWRNVWKNRFKTEIAHDPEFLARLKEKMGKTMISQKPKYIETTIVSDKKIIQFYKGKKDLETYLLTVMNMISGLFHDASIGNIIHFTVVRLIYLEKDEEKMDLQISQDADATLDSFCEWQMSINPKQEDHPNHHDVAVLVTKYDLCVDEGETCDTVGLASIGEACNPESSCTINEDNGLKLGISITHEIGHLLGCIHDTPEDSGCDAENIKDYDFVMGPYLDLFSVQWSNCSREIITGFMKSGLGKCFEDKPTEHHWDHPDMLLGAMYGADEQCKMQFEKDYPSCDQGPDANCKALWCRTSEKTCSSAGSPPFDGTKCENNKWCFNKKCVPYGQRPNAINGGWGPWGPLEPCSRTCGGGISFRRRECNNPQPQFGGTFCIGNEKDYVICNKNPCPEGSMNFKDVQCSEYNKRNISGFHQWKYVYVKDNNPCALFCVNEELTYSKLSPRMRDGTPCNFGTKDRCITGFCRKVGCDWMVDSEKVEDSCLVCGGDGSNCLEHEETFTQENGEGYVLMWKIPVGARNVKVVELGDSMNAIAVSNADGSKYYLNEDYNEENDGVYSFGRGVKGIYLHPTADKEELLITGPTVEELAVYCVFNEDKNYGVKLQYFMKSKSPYSPKYYWQLVKWDDCSALCGGGTQVAEPKCVEAKAGIVSHNFCSKIKKPKTVSRKCNMKPCKVKWKVGIWSNCHNALDGTMKKTRKIQCVRTANKIGGHDTLLNDKECGARPPTEKTCDPAGYGGSSLQENMKYVEKLEQNIGTKERDNKQKEVTLLEYKTYFDDGKYLAHDTLNNRDNKMKIRLPFGKYENPTPKTVVDLARPVVIYEAPIKTKKHELKLSEEMEQTVGDKIPENFNRIVLDTSEKKTYTGKEGRKKFLELRYNTTERL